LQIPWQIWWMQSDIEWVSVTVGVTVAVADSVVDSVDAVTD
jgi:hypothetical protein